VGEKTEKDVGDPVANWLAFRLENWVNVGVQAVPALDTFRENLYGN